eukprot:1196066-Prorocentrum_minimum.AAC.4
MLRTRLGCGVGATLRCVRNIREAWYRVKVERWVTDRGVLFKTKLTLSNFPNPPYLEIGGFDSVPKILVAFPPARDRRVTDGCYYGRSAIIKTN